MTRLRTSRPMSSVPKGWARLGADSRISGWGASGSYGATTSANVAVSASSTMIPADATPSGLRLSAVTSSPSQPWPSATGSPANVEVRAMAKGGSVVPDARIEPRVHEVDHEVEAHQRASHEQDRKSTRLNSSHLVISYAVFCLKKKKGTAVVMPYTQRFESGHPTTVPPQ